MTTDNSNGFLVSWDEDGLEACVDLGALEQEIMWNTLQGQSTPVVRQMIDGMMMRVKTKTLRQYEIYTLHVNTGINRDDLVEMFNQDWLKAVELIRMHGIQIFSNVKEKELKWNMLTQQN